MALIFQGNSKATKCLHERKISKLHVLLALVSGLKAHESRKGMFPIISLIGNYGKNNLQAMRGILLDAMMTVYDISFINFLRFNTKKAKNRLAVKISGCLKEKYLPEWVIMDLHIKCTAKCFIF